MLAYRQGRLTLSRGRDRNPLGGDARPPIASFVAHDLGIIRLLIPNGATAQSRLEGIIRLSQTTRWPMDLAKHLTGRRGDSGFRPPGMPDDHLGPEGHL